MNGLHHDLHRHAAGRGISPVPAEGAGFWDKVKGFGKMMYNQFQPALKKAGTTLAKDVLADLNRRVIDI